MSNKAEPVHQHVAQRISITAILCISGYLLFSLVDPFLYPSHTLDFLGFRSIAIIYVLSLLLLRKHLLEKHILPIVYISALIVPLPTTLETFYTDGFGSPYYVGLLLIDIGGRLVYPVQAKRGVKISAVIFAPYLILSFVHGDIILAQAVQSIFHITVCILISTVGGELIYRLYINQDKSEKELKRLNNALADQSLRDPLTNAFNRRHLQQMLSNQIALFRRYETPFSLIISDLDNFKLVNDINGHQIGDSVLSEVCNSIHEKIREEDVLFRFGGDEFALILPNTTSDYAANLGERIRDGIQKLEIKSIGVSRQLTISMGIAQIVGDDSEQSIIRRADVALYRAKDGGRDKVEVADEISK